MVVVHHCFRSVPFDAETRLALFQSPLAPLFSSQGAVVLFFVLSGYVLTGSLLRQGRWLDTGQFYVKRVFRIQVPFIFAALLSWVASAGYGAAAGAGSSITPWLMNFALESATPEEMLRGIAFPGMAAGMLPVGWSLRVEMIYSLLLPLMFLVVRQLHPAAVVMLALLPLPFWESPWARAVIHLHIAFAACFALGILCYLHGERVGRWLSRAPAVAGVGFALAGLLLFSAPLLLDWSRETKGVLVQNDLRGGVVLTFGSAILVLAAANLRWLQRPLTTRPVLFLGRVSYSLYLLHLTVLILVVPWVLALSPWQAFPALLGLVLAITLPLSELSYRLVERPAIAAGNRLCRLVASATDGIPLRSRLSRGRPA